ncbi:MAG: 23S rRNA (pseudouridine(1915)-N(3))-methyltransferase RlmH [Pseudomonadota bacterium]
MFSIKVIGVGRMGRGAEAQLCDTYAERISNLSHRWRLKIIEIDDRKAPQGTARRAWDFSQINAHIDQGAELVALDECGASMTSNHFARYIERLAGIGTPLCFALGGPDGLDEDLRKKAHSLLSLGAMTWPHKLARALLLEQIYRAGTILAGHPYHRE